MIMFLFIAQQTIVTYVKNNVQLAIVLYKEIRKDLRFVLDQGYLTMHTSSK